MFDLQIPYWAMTACGGYVLGIASVVALAAWLNWWKRRQVLDTLGELGAEMEGENDAEIDHSGD